MITVYKEEIDRTLSERTPYLREDGFIAGRATSVIHEKIGPGGCT